MQTANYRFMHRSGRGFYAHVWVTIRPSQSQVVEVSNLVCAEDYPEAPTGPETLRRAAELGVRYALQHANSSERCWQVEVDRIRHTTSDSSMESVAFAACHATWLAIGEKDSSVKPEDILK